MDTGLSFGYGYEFFYSCYIMVSDFFYSEGRVAELRTEKVTLFYKMYGEGFPLFLVSGFSVNHSLWSGIISRLSESYKVIVLDNRGAGRSSVPAEPYSIAEMARDIAELAQHLNITSAYFCGNSMGGFILQELAYQFPSLVKKMIISNSAYSTETSFGCFAQARFEWFDLPVSPEVNRSFVKASCSYAYSYKFLSIPGKLEEIIDQALADPYPIKKLGYAGQMHALSEFDFSAHVSSINVPTLVMAGDQDIIFSLSMVAALASALPNSEYHVFKECGHIPHVEYPDEFIQLLHSFLSA
jgi:3-oxoadipate enol-lactonase